MVVVPLSKSANDFAASPDYEAVAQPETVDSESMNWIGFAAGGSLVAAGLLLLVGERRAGMVAAASGTALALLDQQETLCTWWNALPGYIEQTEKLLTQVQDTVTDISVKREALRRVLAR